MANEKIRVLIADDSAIIRGLLEKAFSAQGDFEVVGTVSNGRKAVDVAGELHPELVITDYDMPELDGVEATRRIRAMGIPVVMFAETTAVRDKAMRAGVLSFEKKPSLAEFKMDSLVAFAQKVRGSYTQAHGRSRAAEGASSREAACGSYKILCVGASTGGPSAMLDVLNGLGKHFPLAILYAQHIDIGADAKMARWFDDSCPGMTVRLARDGEEALPGTVYMAPADLHLVVDHVNSAGNAVLRLSDEVPEHFLRPAVNKLFKSAATHYKGACLAVLLTGMGRDGAEGCKAVVNAGGHTVVEDKSTCAVFGMPAAAIELGAADEVLPRQKIAGRLIELARGASGKGAQ